MSSHFLHALVHVTGHAIKHYVHERHKNFEASRHAAHRLSTLAGAVFDGCHQLGGAMKQLTTDYGSFSYSGGDCSFGSEGGSAYGLGCCGIHFRCLNGTIERLMETRNCSLAYGNWKSHPRRDGKTFLLYCVEIDESSVCCESVAEVAKLIRDEVPQFERLLRATGF